jgi:hypothetical protein
MGLIPYFIVKSILLLVFHRISNPKADTEVTYCTDLYIYVCYCFWPYITEVAAYLLTGEGAYSWIYGDNISSILKCGIKMELKCLLILSQEIRLPYCWKMWIQLQGILWNLKWMK